MGYNAISAGSLREWVKARGSPLARLAYRGARWALSASVPVIPALHRPLYRLHWLVADGIDNALRVLWRTPLFQSRLERPAPGLRLTGGLPPVLGPLKMIIGADCRLSGRFVFMGRSGGASSPVLQIGRNVDLGWGGSIAVGRFVSIGDNVRLAPGVMLAGYPGHPLDASARARGEPETEDQVGDIIIDDDAWLATGVKVMAGVRIGRGAIIAAGSVVTRDIPAFVMAAGAPARPVKTLPGGADEPR
jgi:hypothetical protein